MASSARRRVGGGPGGAQWMALGGAVLVILGLTFALGLLVGRQWARHTATAVVASVIESAKKPVTATRRGGIAAETMADRAPESTEKLTFYKTLTEPLDGPASVPKPEAKPVAIRIPPATPSSLPPPAPVAPVMAKPVPAPPPAQSVSLPPAPAKPASGKTADGKTTDAKATDSKTTDGKTADAKTADGGSAGAISGPPHTNTSASAAVPSVPYTIQVGAYKNRRQADDLRQQLASASLDAYVVTLAAQEGVARYRVRVGTYRSREEAASAAERLRTQRSLTTFITPK
jgi:cell division protein FtsN